MTDGPLETFALFAGYNRAANERLYQACAGLSDEARRRDRKAFFASIHATLNHIMVGDRIWLTRFEGGTAPSVGLDAILYEDFDALRSAREQEDLRIERFVAGLEPRFLEGTVRYVNNQGRDCEDPAGMLLLHFFNHQTHHRGQVHDMLCQAGAETPVLDLHRVLRP